MTAKKTKLVKAFALKNSFGRLRINTNWVSVMEAIEECQKSERIVRVVIKEVVK